MGVIYKQLTVDDLSVIRLDEICVAAKELDRLYGVYCWHCTKYGRDEPETVTAKQELDDGINQMAFLMGDHF